MDVSSYVNETTSRSRILDATLSEATCMCCARSIQFGCLVKEEDRSTVDRAPLCDVSAPGVLLLVIAARWCGHGFHFT